MALNVETTIALHEVIAFGFSFENYYAGVSLCCSQLDRSPKRLLLKECAGSKTKCSKF